MKNSKYFFYSLIISVIFVLTISCNFSENLGEFNTVLSLDVVQNKKQLFFVNANSQGTSPKNINLSFSGNVKDDIFSNLGKRVSSLENNSVIIGLKRGILVSIDNPESVIMKIEADGFITKEIPLLFNGEDEQNIIIPILEKANLPESIQIIEKDIVLENGVIKEEVLIEVENPNEIENLLEITLEKGTLIKDKEGNTISTNNLSISLQTFDTNASGLENDNFSAVSEITPFLNPKKGEQLVPFSTFKIDLKANGEDVFLSKSFKISVPNPTEEISNSSKISSENRKSQIEEDLSMFVFNDEFDLHGEFIPNIDSNKPNRVIVEGGDSIIGSNLTSSFWVLGVSIPSCNLNVKFKNTSIATKYLIQVASTLAPERLLDYEEVFIAHNNFFEITGDALGDENFTGFNRQFSFQQFPTEARLKITAQLIDGTSVVVLDQNYNNCSLNETEIDVTLPNQPSEFVDLDMNLECRNESYSLDSHSIFYYKLNSNNPSRLFLYGLINEGRLTSVVPLLEDETSYVVFELTGEQIAIKGNEIKFLKDKIDQENFCSLIGR
ncbi:hypothetical protein KO506_13865 [Polaribacter vadi]|uniref:hypothetical protein n=1 Tax=Polaribacter TaxID=52959 RepID=UPI001C097381|nr:MULTISPECIES: hypothetical protein [Polaribacter]MBU3012494.1 hypothetical protein [Polaribacter vadi]MDO6742311.1 hypothetical protein [Polaribacter sp. 1_MG-2023]